MSGITMATTYAVIGCIQGGPTLIPPAEFSSATVRLPAAATVTSTAVAAGRVEPAAASTPFVSAGYVPGRPERRWKYIVFHHSATAEGSVAAIDAEHRTRKDRQGKPWMGIGYHFVIGNGRGMDDGQIEPTFRWREQLHGAHAGNPEHNELGIGICFVGDFNQAPPTARQLAAARQLVRELALRYSIAPADIVRHRDVGPTECPGSQFPLEQMVDRAAAKSAGREEASEP